MALIHCPSCGKQISDEARSCINCGHPMVQKENSVGTLLKIIIIIVPVMLGLFLLMCVGGGIFFSKVGQNVVDQINNSKIENTKLQIKQFESALKLFKLDNGFYPDTEQGLDALTSIPTTGMEPAQYDPKGYLKGDKIPLDQWGTPYVYYGPNERLVYQIISAGPDGIEGTNDDITNNNID